jgi:hypothetical protein
MSLSCTLFQFHVLQYQILEDFFFLLFASLCSFVNFFLFLLFVTLWHDFVKPNKDIKTCYLCTYTVHKIDKNLHSIKYRIFRWSYVNWCRWSCNGNWTGTARTVCWECRRGLRTDDGWKKRYKMAVLPVCLILLLTTTLLFIPLYNLC